MSISIPDLIETLTNVLNGDEDSEVLTKLRSEICGLLLSPKSKAVLLDHLDAVETAADYLDDN